MLRLAVGWLLAVRCGLGSARLHTFSFFIHNEENSLASAQRLYSSLDVFARESFDAKGFYLCNISRSHNHDHSHDHDISQVPSVTTDSDLGVSILPVDLGNQDNARYGSVDFHSESSVSVGHSIDRGNAALQCWFAVTKLLFFTQPVYEDVLLYVDPKFVASSDRLLSFHGGPSYSKHSLHCLAARPASHPMAAINPMGHVCDFRIFSSSVAAAMSLQHQLLGASDFWGLQLRDFSAIMHMNLLEAGLSSLSFFPSDQVNIVYANQYYVQERGAEIAAIEFDDEQHKLEVNRTSCRMNLHVASTHFNTLRPIQSVFARLSSPMSASLLRRFSRCDRSADSEVPSNAPSIASSFSASPFTQSVLSTVTAADIAAATTAARFRSDLHHVHAATAASARASSRVFNCVLLNDELPQLSARLEYYADLVDYFIFVEANESFAHQSKPFYFSAAAKSHPQRFALRPKYAPRDAAHTLDTSSRRVATIKLESIDTALSAEDAMAYSWKACAHGLQHFQATVHDVLLLTHSDELPSLSAIRYASEFVRYASSFDRSLSRHKSPLSFGSTDKVMEPLSPPSLLTLPLVLKLPSKWRYDSRQQCFARQRDHAPGRWYNRSLYDLATVLSLRGCDVHYPVFSLPPPTMLVEKYAECIAQSRVHFPLSSDAAIAHPQHRLGSHGVRHLMPRAGYLLPAVRSTSLGGEEQRVCASEEEVGEEGKEVDQLWKSVLRAWGEQVN